ncbi:unnamed protein product [Somion occarium]|uniref:Uncharacterized protein n=1 Tax=Somion occarium TaxID=3059160 RepID=A0ABP1DG62_9APHY
MVSQKDARNHDRTSDHDLDPIDSLSSTIGNYSNSENSEEAVIKLIARKDDTSLSFASRVGLGLCASGLIGCYSLKYFVRQSNLRVKRLWLGSVFAATAYNAFNKDKFERFIVKVAEPNHELHSVFLPPMSLYFASFEPPTLPKDALSTCKEIRMKFAEQESISARILMLTRTMWCTPNTWAFCAVLFGKGLGHGAPLSGRDFDICISHLANWVDLEKPTLFTRMRNAIFCSWVGAITIRLFSHRVLFSRLSASTAVASFVAWFTLDHLRHYHLFYDPLGIQNKKRIEDIYRNHPLFRLVFQEVDRLISEGGDS